VISSVPPAYLPFATTQRSGKAGQYTGQVIALPALAQNVRLSSFPAQPSTAATPSAAEALGLTSAVGVSAGSGVAVGATAGGADEASRLAVLVGTAADVEATLGRSAVAAVLPPMHAETVSAKRRRIGRRDRRTTGSRHPGALDRGRVTLGSVARDDGRPA
jgi:hypothetical protein